MIDQSLQTNADRLFFLFSIYFDVFLLFMCVLLPVNAGMQTKCHCGVTIAKKGRNYHNECSDCEKTRLSKYQRPSSAPSSSSSSSLSFSSIPTPSFSLLARPASASTHTPLTVDRRLGIVGAVEAEAPMDIIQQKSC